ncbi:MAG: tripartite tricarboxylate transporter TctB family protein [Burkholderiales bacterium]|nr:tripartite tricarboxylate transporter TctB family protein [Burkholderiales bacterium]MDE2289316.1 tripartite tricarboxylate transporter TctB family protein [Burkholderiales bacterium]MDE2611560.1 tripartite tricarboxylate transporter TctB family protein [Burkholderiales bacterium]
MKVSNLGKRDFWAGTLFVLIGAGVYFRSRSYGIGSLSQMGSGFFPAALGVLMAIVGLLIAATSREAAVLVKPSGKALRGAGLVLLSVVAFVVVAPHLGLLPATFVSVIVAAFADSKNSVRDVFLMAAVLTVFCFLVFSWGLHIQLPALSWE